MLYHKNSNYINREYLIFAKILTKESLYNSAIYSYHFFNSIYDDVKKKKLFEI